MTSLARTTASVLLAFAGIDCGLHGAPVAVSDCGPVPAPLRAALKLAPFYEQCVLAGDFPIVASSKVSPAALCEAGHIIAAMMEHRPEVLAAITKQRVRLAVMAYDEYTTDVPEHSKLEPREYWDKRARGLGASSETLTVSCGEENLTCLKGDPYAAENILVHEFGHVVHEFGMKSEDPTFDDRLNEIYQDAMKQGLWHGKYAATNRMEYWAEGVQSWFDTNRHDDFEHNHVHTRAQIKEYDPGLAALLESVFGDGAWRYARPSERTPPPAHFAGFDAAHAPEFRWPQRLLAWSDGFKKGNVTLAPRSATRVDLVPESSRETWKSAGGGARSKLYVLNVSAHPVVLDWVDFEGRPQRHAILRNGDHFETDTFVGHNWRVTPEAGDAPSRCFTAGEGVSDVVVK